MENDVNEKNIKQLHTKEQQQQCYKKHLEIALKYISGVNVLPPLYLFLFLEAKT